MKPNYLVITIALVLASCYTAVAIPADGGTNNPFEYGAGSRALAMGGAYVALANDVSALFWNPAGLATLEQPEVAAMHIQLFFDTPYDFLGVAYPVLDWGTFSVGVVRLATGDIILRDDRAVLSDNETGELDMREYAISYGREILFGINAGVTMKIDQQRLLGDYSTGVGTDLGLYYRLPALPGLGGLPWENFTFGVIAQNVIGSTLKLQQAIDTLPLNLKAGMAYQHRTKDSLQQTITVSLMWEKSTWQSSRLAIGGEYSLLNLIALRGGLNSDSWSAGGGIQYAGIMVDYALGAEILGFTHRFTLTYRFGVPLSRQRELIEQQRQAELDREAKARAEAAVQAAQETYEEKMKTLRRQHRREKRAMRSQQRRLLAREKRKATEERKAAAADEYFKALHYFQGIKDYTNANYESALLEFETVEKYDADYLDLKVYMSKTNQRMQGGTALSEESMKLYYQGIDLYVEERFQEAIVIWRTILESEPNNILVLRNIEEAEERLARLKTIEQQLDEEIKVTE